MPFQVDQTADERFWSKVQEPFDVHNDCWLWTGALDISGYGRFRVGSHSDGTRTERKAHRWAYEFFDGPISAGMLVDHLCRNRKCVNPTHLRLVTPRQNVLENSIGTAATNAQKTFCLRGHELSSNNVYLTPSGARQCRECSRQEKQRRRAKSQYNNIK